MQKYKCPECKKMQDSAIQWQTRSTAYNYNLKTEEYEEIDNIIGETEGWNCSECEKELPYKIYQKFN